MRRLLYCITLILIKNCFAADTMLPSIRAKSPYPLCQQAADRLIMALPEEVKTPMSRDILAKSMERIVLDRVENHTLIENILLQTKPLKSKETALLLLLIGHNEALRAQEVPEQE